MTRTIPCCKSLLRLLFLFFPSILFIALLKHCTAVYTKDQTYKNSLISWDASGKIDEFSEPEFFPQFFDEKERLQVFLLSFSFSFHLKIDFYSLTIKQDKIINNNNIFIVIFVFANNFNKLLSSNNALHLRIISFNYING